MIALIFSLITLLMAGLDYAAYRRYISAWSNVWLRRSTVAAIVMLDITPYVMLAMLEWVVLDNSASAMAVIMSVCTVYFITTLSRIALYTGVFLIRNRKAGIIVGTLLGSLVFGTMLYGAAVTRTDISVTETELKYDTLPAAFDGYRIAFFSDLHIGSMLNPERECRALAERINATDADLVIFSGDLVNTRYSELDAGISDILRSIRARDGVVAVLGNHDTGVYIRDSIALPRTENTRLLTGRIEEMGWILLRDSTLYLHRGADSIAVTGIDYSERLLEYKHSLRSPESYDAGVSFTGVEEPAFDIAVSHLPQLWRNITASGHGDLTLSGHVHATQAKLDLGFTVLSPARLMYREWSGLYEDEAGRRLYVNDGIGYVGYYIRIGANPEITVITLQR